jgi:hypothetical protein
MENRKTNADTPTDADLFGNNQYVRRKPLCPANGTYTLNAVDTVPTCSIAGPPAHALP